MDTLSDTTARILDIESRQDDAIRQLIELENRLEQILRQYGGVPTAAIPVSPVEAGRATQAA